MPNPPRPRGRWHLFCHCHVDSWDSGWDPGVASEAVEGLGPENNRSATLKSAGRCFSMVKHPLEDINARSQVEQLTNSCGWAALTHRSRAAWTSQHCSPKNSSHQLTRLTQLLGLFQLLLQLVLLLCQLPSAGGCQLAVTGSFVMLYAPMPSPALFLAVGAWLFILFMAHESQRMP